MIYYIIEFQNNKKCKYVLWFEDQNNQDRVLTNKTNEVISFDCIEEIKEYANVNNIKVYNKIYKYDLNDLSNYKTYLNIWNICSDICNSINIMFVGNERQYDSIYEQLYQNDEASKITKNHHKNKMTEVDEKKLQLIIGSAIDIIDKTVFNQTDTK